MKVLMPDLVTPTTTVHESFLAAMEEFRTEGRGGLGDDSMIGNEMRRFGDSWGTPEGFERYTKYVRDQSLEESPRPPGYVPCTTLWWVEGDDYLGRIAIRHRLTPWLLEAGGHIGYDVRKSARLKGHATAMLRQCLPVTNRLGIDPALITCDDDNLASRKVIEANGGIFEDQRGNKLRFWVPTAT